MPVAVEFDHVHFGYPEGREVLRDVDLRIEANRFVGIAGPNGGGKTTLVRLGLGLLRPSAGTVRLFGEQPSGRSPGRAAYLPQRVASALDAPVTVSEVVATGRVGAGRIFGPLRPADREAVAWAIERVGLGGLAGRRLNHLSGGQQQRAFIAKAIVSRPELLVLDEPTAGVDVDAQHGLAALLDELRRDLGMTILYVSHEFGAIEEFVERLVVVAGRIAFDGAARDLPATWHDPSHVHP